MQELSKPEQSQEFLERSKILALERENIELKHKFKMEELDFDRCNTLKMHEQILERGRISRAEERKMLIERRSLSR